MGKMGRIDHEENPVYHNTELLLKKYRTSVWSLEVSAKRLDMKFQQEVGMNIEDFLDSLYMAGMELGNTASESQAQWLEVTRKRLALVDFTPYPCSKLKMT